MADACNTHTHTPAQTHPLWKSQDARRQYLPLPQSMPSIRLVSRNITQWFLLRIVDPSISFLAIFRIFHKSVFAHTQSGPLWAADSVSVCVELSDARRQFILITTNSPPPPPLPSPFAWSCRRRWGERVET